jgi:hypothetical protein
VLHNKYKIVRKNYGWFKRKFDILFKYIKPRHQNILLESEFARPLMRDDAFVDLVFRIADLEAHKKKRRAHYYNPFTGDITLYRGLEESSKEMPWLCAICKVDIVSRIDDFEPSNFLCVDCKEVHADAELVDVRIKDSSVKFTNYCKKHLSTEQNRYISYLRREMKREIKRKKSD